MKIKILTFFNVGNPGADLQAYALCRYLSQEGHEPELIDYRPQAIRQAKGPVAGLADSLPFLPKRLWGAYPGFHRDVCPDTGQRYEEYAQLRHDPPPADAYICGSDQIWNPKLLGGRVDPAYYLDFGPDRIRRISYAASFGGTTLSADQRDDARQLLQKLDYISVREKSGAEQVRDICGREAAITVDPAILVEDYGPVCANNREPGSYFLLYPVVKTKEAYTAALRAARAAGKPLLTIASSLRPWSVPGRPVRPRGLAEWLGLFKNADCVITNSYHGTICALHFHRPFVVVPLSGDISSRNVRLEELCAALGLEERVADGAGKDVKDAMKGRISWQQVEKGFAEKREHSKAFLREALS